MQKKLPPDREGVNPQEVAATSEPPVVIPVVVVAVAIHVALVVIPVERDEMCNLPSFPPPFEYS